LRVRVAHLGIVDLTQIGKMAFRAMYFTEVILCLTLCLFGAYKAVMQTDVTALSENCCLTDVILVEREANVCVANNLFIYFYLVKVRLCLQSDASRCSCFPHLFDMVGRRIKNFRNSIIPSKTN